MSDLMIVVDDNKISRMLPGILLKPYNITILECESGEEALRLIEIHRVRWMLIDISMPNFGGVDVVNLISKRSKYSDINLIAYTADSRFGNSDEYLMLGFHRLLIKPLRMYDLLTVLEL